VKNNIVLLREFIIESINSPYDEDLTDDESYNDESMLVPDDIKKVISKWARAMCLSSTGNRRTHRRVRRA
jgi:hypothetical protein